MPKKVPKFGVKEVIQFIGLKDLEPEEQANVSRLATQYYEKIDRFANNLQGMTVHIKTYEKEGTKKKFSIHIRLKVPSKATIECDKTHDFDLVRALHKAFNDIIEQTKHYFRKDTTRPKAYE